VLSGLEYDFLMRRRFAVTVAVFGTIFIALTFTPSLCAQINGVPASVTSIGFGGNFRSMPGVPASVTSLGPNGFQPSPFFNEPACCINPLFPTNPNPPLSQHRHHRDHGSFFPVAVPVYTMPYTPVVVVQPEANEYEEEDYSGGPTIFDRRGPGRSARLEEDRYAERARRDERDLEPGPASVVPEETPVADQPETLLVFKDGHQLEVQNYAVVGDMLYDLTPGHRRKIALAELDLPATAKQNDDRGIDFQLPVDRN
jgi:hypothetical protein